MLAQGDPRGNKLEKEAKTLYKIMKGLDEISAEDIGFKKYLLDVFACYHPVVEDYSCCLKIAVIQSKAKWTINK